MLRNSTPRAGRRSPIARRRVAHRFLAAIGAVTAVVTIGAMSAVADPPPPNPTNTGAELTQHIRDVNRQLDRLSRQSEQLDEQYNVAAAAVARSQQAATRAEHASQAAAIRYRTTHAEFVNLVRQRYESGPVASIGTLLTTGSPQEYLDALATNAYLSDRLAGTLRDERWARDETIQAARHAKAAAASARTKQAALAKRRAALQRESRRFRQLLATLTDQQQRERAHAQAVSAARARATLDPKPPVARAKGQAPVKGQAPGKGQAPIHVSGSVQRVINFAEAQVGKAYGYGADGPDAYDCSGLTMAAWAKAGVHLPHSAAAQYGYGTHVSYGDLQPGDLIFLYSPIGHVELYVGHDLAVSAADYGTGVVYVHPSRDRGDFAGATRLTG